MHVVITGATKGLGKAVAEKFAAAGNTLFVCARNEVDLYHLADELTTKFPDCIIHALATDVSDKKEVDKFAGWCLQKATPDILVNNAGQFLPGSVFNEDDGLLQQMLDVNLFSAYHLTRALLPRMTAAKNGHIFNMCSIASLHAYANGGSYSISKFALYGFSKNLREEMKPHNIKVTAVLPGAVYTDSWSGSGVDPQRIMEAKDIADMIFAAANLSPQACVEDIIIRPQLGDL